jgi:predicted PurR-regulated permease PerM
VKKSGPSKSRRDRARAPYRTGRAPDAPKVAPPEKVIAFSSTYAKIFFAAITVLTLYFVYIIIKPYLVQIFLAFVLFLASKPLFRSLVWLFRGRRALPAFITCLVLGLLITLPLFALVNIIAKQALELYSSVSSGLKSEQFWQQISGKWEFLRGYAESLGLTLPEQANLEQVLQTVLTHVSQFIYSNAIDLVRGFTSYFLNLLLILFIAFFMLLQGDDFIDQIKKLSPMNEAHNQEILQVTESTIKATLWGTLIVALVQGILGGAGFFLFRIPEPVFWGTMMMVVSILPVIGPAIIWAPGVVFLYLRGDPALALGLFLWGAIIVSMVDNLLRPLLIKGAQSTSTILIFLSILGGVTYFGMVGFILGPLLLSFLLSLLRIYQRTVLATIPEKAVSFPQSESQNE